MDFDLEVKLAVYRHFAQTAKHPSPDDVAEVVRAPAGDVIAAYARLRSQRVLVLEADGRSIRMAPPFSGVATQHVVVAGNLSYFANCAWDALGIPAALQQPAIVHSRCEQSREPLRLEVSRGGLESSDWLFHCLVPAAHWWDDIVFT
jgi:alkylmercury lyase-like protein